MKVSIVIPVYNEAATIRRVVQRVLDAPLGPGDHERELVIVDDASTDGTGTALDELAASPQIVVIRQKQNRGKGAALRAAFARVSGDIVIIQDADMEYDPADFPRLLGPIVDGHADVVFGSRFARAGDGTEGRPPRGWHGFGNRALTLVSNLTTGLKLTDMETCYKAFRREVLTGIAIEEDRFGVEPELTAKVAAAGWRVREVGISYAGRTYAEGKKIGWRDGVRAVWCIVKYGVLRRGRSGR